MGVRGTSRVPRAVLVGGVLVLAILLLAAVALVGLRAWRSAHRSTVAQAVALAPSDAQRLSFTDWAGVRREVGARVDERSPYDDVAAFLDDAYPRDLTSESAMIDSTQMLQERFGFSPASVDWELFSQGTRGAAVVLRLPDDTDTDALAEQWDALGYTRPDDATGVWDGGEDLVGRLNLELDLSPEYQFLALDADDHVVVASDSADYARTAMRAVTGAGPRLVDDAAQGLGEAVTAVADEIGEPLSASVYTGSQVCRALAMSQADETDQAEADTLVARAGTVDPLTAFAMGLQPDGTALVAMGLESEQQARANADSRARLASGPAPGQGGDFTDRFTLRQASADGSVVVLDLAPVGGAYLLSDLSTGPVLYATC